jgi:hypothetical protein
MLELACDNQLLRSGSEYSLGQRNSSSVKAAEEKLARGKVALAYSQLILI